MIFFLQSAEGLETLIILELIHYAGKCFCNSFALVFRCSLQNWVKTPRVCDAESAVTGTQWFHSHDSSHNSVMFRKSALSQLTPLRRVQKRSAKSFSLFSSLHSQFTLYWASELQHKGTKKTYKIKDFAETSWKINKIDQGFRFWGWYRKKNDLHARLKTLIP